MKKRVWLCFVSIILVVLAVCCNPFVRPMAWGIVCLDSACVGCHILGTAINISLTHPNLATGCITCHSPECLTGFHKDTIRQLDPLFYLYNGTATNKGCNVCHGAPPQALCLGGLVTDHCLDPAGCNPEIFVCGACHLNFDGTPKHIYPKVIGIPFAPVAGIAKCLACHGLSLFVGRSGAHATHFISKLMVPATTSSAGIIIGCAVCHPDLTVNLGADHLVCVPGTSNAWLPGKVPVAFNPLLPQIGVGDVYIPGPVGGTGSCMVYCHSNGQTPPNTLLTAGLGYPGSFLPLPWNITFIRDPLILDCGCCHTYPPLTHTATKTTCNQCHPTPVLGTAPNSLYHINGLPDLWKYLAAASPMIPLTLSPTLSPTTNNDLLLMSGLGFNLFGNLSGPSSSLSTINAQDPILPLLASFGMIGGLMNPLFSPAFSQANLTLPLSLTNPSLTFSPFLGQRSLALPGFQNNGFGFLSTPSLNTTSTSTQPTNNTFLTAALGLNKLLSTTSPYAFNQFPAFSPLWNPLPMLSPSFMFNPFAFQSFTNPFFYGGLRNPFLF